jgi:hypothetical protein
MVPSALTITVPCLGCVTILTLAGFKLAPKFAALSFARILVVTGVLTTVDAISGFTIGGLIFNIGSTTVITNGTNGQAVVCPAAHTGT